jgi:hypothetical protein
MGLVQADHKEPEARMSPALAQGGGVVVGCILKVHNLTATPQSVANKFGLKWPTKA